MASRFVAVICVTAIGVALGGRNEQQEKGGSVQKVIQMLGDMLAKAKMEKNTEEINFAEFNTWCADEKVNLAKSIKSEGESIEVLTNGIAKSQSDIKGLAGEIATLQSDLAKYEADLKSQVSERAKENKAFLAESQDFSESVDAIERAIAVLQKQSFDRPGSSAALLQLSESTELPQNAKAMIQAFMGMMDADAAPGSPEANAYEFQSGSVVDMLKKLRDDFSSQLGNSQKEEMNSKHASDMVTQDLKTLSRMPRKMLGRRLFRRRTRLRQWLERRKNSTRPWPARKRMRPL